jgi:hypothetical protein
MSPEICPRCRNVVPDTEHGGVCQDCAFELRAEAEERDDPSPPHVGPPREEKRE